jgi:hypothetical protein
LSISLHSVGFPSTLQILDQIDQPGDAAHADGLGTLSRVRHPVPAGRLLAQPRRRRLLPDASARPGSSVPVHRTRVPAFAEPLPGVAQTRARQTDRLRAVHRTMALGGNPGARHAAAMGVPISRTTLLTRVRTSDAVPGPAVSVLGVDDWARCQGPALRHHPGRLGAPTRGRPAARADTLAAWLTDHPSVSAVPRRRLCRGSRPGCPGRYPGGGPMAFAAQQQRRPAHGPRPASLRSARRSADRRPTTGVG